MYLEIIRNKLKRDYYMLQMFLMLVYIKILIVYFIYAENLWVNYYLRMNQDHDTVMKKIRANKICPHSIPDLYNEFYEKYSEYYNKDWVFSFITSWIICSEVLLNSCISVITLLPAPAKIIFEANCIYPFKSRVL